MEVVTKDKQPNVLQPTLVSLKAEKLASALYLVSSPLSDQDPLKWALRDKALAVVSHILLPGRAQAEESIKHLLSLMSITATNSVVSEMNLSVLKHEYTMLAEALRAEAHLALALPSTPVTPPPSVVVNNKKFASNTVVAVTTSRPAQPSKHEQNHSGRREAILKHLRGKGWLSIKDIIQSVPNYSSKTVQRELADMAKNGLLKKEGERRWSRYTVDFSAPLG